MYLLLDVFREEQWELERIDGYQDHALLDVSHHQVLDQAHAGVQIIVFTRADRDRRVPG